MWQVKAAQEKVTDLLTNMKHYDEMVEQYKFKVQ